MFKKMDKRLLIYTIIIVCCLFFFLILLLIIKSASGNRITSKQFESKLKDAAISYYKDEKKELPKKNDDKITIPIDKLVDKGYLKEPEKLLKKDVTCKGGVNVSNNNGYYLYQTDITCSDGYSTNLLYKKVLKDNPTKTTGDGLYNYGTYYLFRGEKLDNYVLFANMKWRILRINKDNSLRLILADNLEAIAWDDRYNLEKDEDVGKNNFEISRIKEELDDYFNNKYEDIFKDSDKALIVPTELCIGARNENEKNFDGSIECSKKTKKLPFGLLQVNEYPIVSLDPDCKELYDMQCKNYNYLANLSSFWTITANPKTSYSVYRIGGTVRLANTDSYSQPRIVLNISSEALYGTGSGTYKNPYTIK